MKHRYKISLTIVIVSTLGLNAFAQDELWQTLNAEILKLSQKGKYFDAVLVARNAVKFAEKNYGLNHPKLATSMNNLATLFRIIGRYDDAEIYYSQALIIRNNALGYHHPSVATSLNNLAGLYRAQGRYAGLNRFI